MLGGHKCKKKYRVGKGNGRVRSREVQGEISFSVGCSGEVSCRR